jgi:hypothetical protein
MRRPPTPLPILLVVLLAACGAPGDETASPGEDTTRTARADAPSSDGGTATTDDRVERAVLAAPEPLRATARVIARSGDGPEVTTLRDGPGPLVCLADDPSDGRFRASCYHESLEPFMARGRELRARGVQGSEVDSVRFREIGSGDLAMPDHPAALYTLAGPAPPAPGGGSGLPEGSQRLFVLYVPGAGAEQIGLPAGPVEGYPWLMSSGSPKAHVMFTP